MFATSLILMIDFLNWWTATDGRACVGAILLFLLCVALINFAERKR